MIASCTFFKQLGMSTIWLYIVQFAVFLIFLYVCDSIGSLGKYPDELEVKDIRVKNCTFVGTDNGVRFKTWPDKYPGSVSNISFSDISMENVKNPIIIDQEYQCEPNNCKKKVYLFTSFSLFNSLKIVLYWFSYNI